MLYSGIDIPKDALLQNILDTTQAMLFWKDAQRRFVGVNQAFLDYYGFADQSVLLGKTDEEMGWFSDGYQNDEWQVLREGVTTHMVPGKCRAKGELRDILSSKRPLYNEGKIIGLVGSFLDMTELLRQKDEIAQLNRKLDSIPGGIAVFERNAGASKCISVNACLADLLGLEQDMVLGKSLLSLLEHYMVEGECARFMGELPVLTKERPRFEGTFQFCNHQQKRKIWLHIVCQLVLEPDGQELVYCIYMDVDKLVYYERESKANRLLAEERYAHTMDAIIAEGKRQNVVAQGHYNLTRDQVLSYETYLDELYHVRGTASYDQAFADMMKLSYTEADRKLLRETLDRHHILHRFAQGETQLRVRYRRLLHDDEPLWLAIVMNTFMRPDNGEIEGFSHAYDITEQVLKEAIIDKLGGLGYDELGLVYSGSGFWRCYQYAERQQWLRSLTHTHGSWETEIERYAKENVIEEQQEQAREELRLPVILQQLAEHDTYTVRQTIRRENGVIRQKELKFSYLNEVGETIFYCMSDITEQFEHEHAQIAALRQAKQEAEKANESRAMFFASISHDMRTPLNGVIGYTELALEADEPAVMRDYLAKIRISGTLLLDLINDVLEFGKYISHKISLQEEPVSIQDICERVETVIRPLAADRRLLFTMQRISPYDGLVCADPLRIQQVFVNLLSNSAKFTSVGGWIKNILTEKEHGDFVDCTIVVQDNGIGMSADFLPRIFDAYAQEERRTASKAIGTGLGMAIVKQILELMGGKIRVESRENQGTTFTVQLRLKKYTGKASVHPKGSSQSSTGLLRGKCVLLCEDNELNAEIIQLILEHWGMKVVWARDGQQGIEKLKASEAVYDIVLMDRRMPVMDGLEATEAIRRLEQGTGRHIPVLAMTGDVDEASIASCLAAGMDGHVGKPIDRELLSRKMVSLLQEKEK